MYSSGEAATRHSARWGVRAGAPTVLGAGRGCAAVTPVRTGHAARPAVLGPSEPLHLTPSFSIKDTHKTAPSVLPQTARLSAEGPTGGPVTRHWAPCQVLPRGTAQRPSAPPSCPGRPLGVVGSPAAAVTRRPAATRPAPCSAGESHTLSLCHHHVRWVWAVRNAQGAQRGPRAPQHPHMPRCFVRAA